jgi:spermidine/putrescine ABC transporter ATP-binding subunit
MNEAMPRQALDHTTAVADVQLAGISKRFGDFAAVDAISLEVRRGEWLSLVGPSGCGKSTTLKIIAGFIDPDAGSVMIRGRDLTSVPPYRRNTGMVFQNYALFPHMTVAENVGYGLRLRKIAKDEVARRVSDMLSLVRLSGLEGRYATSELSGGQQQRVALARAMVIEPDVLLLDEPLSNLDARLREELRVEMALLHRKLGLTTVYVTHDQQEALSMSSRVAVMNRGRIEQIGTPEEIYERPASLFVADFIGKATVLAGAVAGTGPGDRISVRLGGAGEKIINGLSHQFCAIGAPVHVVMRAERIRVADAAGSGDRTVHDGAGNRLTGIVRHIAYYGSEISYQVELQGGLILSVSERNDRQRPHPVGHDIELEIRMEDCLCLPARSSR